MAKSVKLEQFNIVKNYIDESSQDIVDSLSTVATTGSYNDLNNKPTIPTKTSQLTNDSGFINELKYAGAELITKNMTGVAKTAYSSVPVNSYGSNSTYQTTVINTDPQKQITHWNSSSGATLDVTFHYPSGVSKALGSIIFNLGTGYGVPSISLWYMNGSTLTKLEDITGIDADNLNHTAYVNSNKVKSNLWVVRFTHTNWINARCVCPYAEIQDGILSGVEKLSYDEAMQAIEGKLNKSGGDMTGTLSVSHSSGTPISITGRSGTATFIEYKGSGGRYAYMGVNSSGKPVIYDTSEKQIALLNDVPNQYVKNVSVSDKVLTLTKQDGSTVDFEGGSVEFASRTEIQTIFS